MSDNRNLLICALADGWTGLVPSVERRCTDCDARIVVDVENLPAVIARGLALICVNCGIKAFTADPDPDFYGLVGGRTVKGIEDALEAAKARITRRHG